MDKRNTTWFALSTGKTIWDFYKALTFKWMSKTAVIHGITKVGMGGGGWGGHFWSGLALNSWLLELSGVEEPIMLPLFYYTPNTLNCWHFFCKMRQTVPELQPTPYTTDLGNQFIKLLTSLSIKCHAKYWLKISDIILCHTISFQLSYFHVHTRYWLKISDIILCHTNYYIISIVIFSCTSINWRPSTLY